jgi:hypothetical protein
VGASRKSKRRDTLARRIEDFVERSFLPQLKRTRRRGGSTATARYHLVISGPGGGRWTIDLNPSAPTVRKGLHGTPTRVLHLRDHDFDLLLKGHRGKPVPHAIGSGFAVLLATRPPVSIPADTLQALLTIGLLDTTIKVDHMNNLPRSTTGAWSFVQFSPTLQARGLVDRDLNIPVKDSDPGKYTQYISLAVGGWWVVTRVRYLVNNLHTTIGFDTLQVTLEPDTIVLRLAFSSNTPTLRGEGYAYLAPLFGIPVGWSDAAFPDLNLTNFVIQLRLRPYITPAGDLALHDIDVDFDATFPNDPIAKAVEATVRDSIRQGFRDNFNTPETRAALAIALRTLIISASSQLPATWKAISIDPNDVSIWG